MEKLWRNGKSWDNLPLRVEDEFMLKAAETFFEWAVKRAAVMIAHAACDQHDRDVRKHGQDYAAAKITQPQDKSRLN